MNKYALFSFILIPAAILLSGCESYHPTNSPRETMTMKSNILTTVTTVETVRPETYSEYLSSLKEIAAEYTSSSADSSRSEYLGGLYRDTAVTRSTDIYISAVTAVTAPPPADVLPSQTAVTSPREPSVTSVPEGNSDETSASTSTCATRMSAVTAPPFDIADIPAVPSADVRPDTAVSRNHN